MFKNIASIIIALFIAYWLIRIFIWAVVGSLVLAFNLAIIVVTVILALPLFVITKKLLFGKRRY